MKIDKYKVLGVFILFATGIPFWYFVLKTFIG